MEYTQENIKQLYDRVISYCIASFGSEPEHIQLEADGTIFCYDLDYDRDRCNEKYVNASYLTQDLDVLTEQRLEREKIKAESDRLEREKRKADQLEREQRERKQIYFQLKKEFGNEK